MKVKQAGTNSGRHGSISKAKSTSILISKDQYHLSKNSINMQTVNASLDFQRHEFMQAYPVHFLL